MRFFFHIANYFDTAISGELSHLDQDVEKHRPLITQLEKVWLDVGAPVARSLTCHVELAFERQELDVYFSQVIKRTVYKPIVIRFTPEQIEQKGVTSWIKNQLIMLFNAYIHSLVHDNENIIDQNFLKNLPFNDCVEKNHIIYNSLLWPIFQYYFPENLLQFYLQSSQKHVWQYVENYGWNNVVEGIFGRVIAPDLEVNHKIRNKIFDLFS